MGFPWCPQLLPMEVCHLGERESWGGGSWEREREREQSCVEREREGGGGGGREGEGVGDRDGQTDRWMGKQTERQTDDSGLLSGPEVYICRHCMSLLGPASAIASPLGTSSTDGKRVKPLIWRGWWVHWSFSGQTSFLWCPRSWWWSFRVELARLPLALALSCSLWVESKDDGS